MGAIFKALNSFLGILAIITCLAAVAIIAYSIIRPDLSRFGIGNGSAVSAEEADSTDEMNNDKETEAETNNNSDNNNIANAPHEHEYREEIFDEPTCTESGRMIFYCYCDEDTYYEEIKAIGHKESAWQQIIAPTATLDGERIKTCLVCDAIIAREVLPKTGEMNTASPEPSAPAASPIPAHVHIYIASITLEPTCTASGNRKFTCSCGSYYNEMIHAIGHLAADWVVSVEATASRTGTRQRICNVCRSLVDTQQIPRLPGPSPSPSPASSASPSGTPGATTTPTGSPSPSPSLSPSPSPSPSPTPHVHSYVVFRAKEPTCSDIGVDTSTCSGCGSDFSVPVPKAADKHNFNANGHCVLCGTARAASPSPGR